MAYNTKLMLKDSNGYIIPQYYNPVKDAFEPLVNLNNSSGANISNVAFTAFANSSAANTQSTLTIEAPINVRFEYEISVYNPSTITDLTVKIFNTRVINGTSRDVLVYSFVVPKSQSVTGTTVSAYSIPVRLMFNGGVPVKIIASNNTVLGGTDGFTPTISIEEVM